MKLTAKEFASAVEQHAAIRRRQRLQPTGGKGDKVFPPTYPDGSAPTHVFERRRVDGAEVACVLLDSVQSQANRLEEALLTAARNGAVELPYLEVDFTESVPDVGRITSLDAPHRVYDAILRDSLLDGTPFMQSELGERLKHAKPSNATALLEVSPNALIFGAWHSQGEGGGLGAKFPRCVVSEIVGVNTPVEAVIDRRSEEIVGLRTAARRTSSRIDPLGILRKVEVYKGASGWSTKKEEAGRNAKQVRPSEINHGNIVPSVAKLGVTMDYAEQVFVLSFAGLRRLQFGDQDKSSVARSYLASLAMLAALEQDAAGYALRSRCDLVPEGKAPWELVHADGTTESIEISLAEARNLYSECLKQARDSGFAMLKQPLRLEPQQKLAEIVRQSQDRALAGEGGEDAGES